MPWTAIASALPALTGGGGGLGGLLGGGRTEVSQSASNSTSVNLTSLLSNQSPNASGGSASGQAVGSAQSASGADAPLSPAPYSVPLEGFNSLGAEDNFNSQVNTGGVPKQAIYALGAITVGLGIFSLMNRNKKRG